MKLTIFKNKVLNYEFVADFWKKIINVYNYFQIKGFPLDIEFKVHFC